MIHTSEFHNFGYLMADIPEELSTILNKEATYIQNNFDKSTLYNANLAGHIKHEYKLKDSQPMLEQYVLSLASEYNSRTDYYSRIDLLNMSVPMRVEHPWINFQSKTEFNPIHNHQGIISFVIWLKIPYDLETEFRDGPGQYRGPDKMPLNSSFQFLYVNSLGQIATHQIAVDKSYENKIILFPAKMMHCVYPFYTSDDFRISVSGNIMLDVASYVK